VGAPLVTPAAVLGRDGAPTANDRVHVGVIGAGIQGKQLIGDMPNSGRVVAVCDCFLASTWETNWPDLWRYKRLSEEPVPKGMRWELFCGPRPIRPYHWRLWQKDEQACALLDRPRRAGWELPIMG
jgi:hypothetical protein